MASEIRHEDKCDTCGIVHKHTDMIGWSCKKCWNKADKIRNPYPNVNVVIEPIDYTDVHRRVKKEHNADEIGEHNGSIHFKRDGQWMATFGNWEMSDHTVEGVIECQVEVRPVITDEQRALNKKAHKIWEDKGDIVWCEALALANREAGN